MSRSFDPLAAEPAPDPPPIPRFYNARTTGSTGDLTLASSNSVKRVVEMGELSRAARKPRGHLRSSKSTDMLPDTIHEKDEVVNKRSEEGLNETWPIQARARETKTHQLRYNPTVPGIDEGYPRLAQPEEDRAARTFSTYMEHEDTKDDLMMAAYQELPPVSCELPLVAQPKSAGGSSKSRLNRGTVPPSTKEVRVPLNMQDGELESPAPTEPPTPAPTNPFRNEKFLKNRPPPLPSRPSHTIRGPVPPASAPALTRSSARDGHSAPLPSRRDLFAIVPQRNSPSHRIVSQSWSTSATIGSSEHSEPRLPDAVTSRPTHRRNASEPVAMSPGISNGKPPLPPRRLFINQVMALKAGEPLPAPPLSPGGLPPGAAPPTASLNHAGEELPLDPPRSIAVTHSLAAVQEDVSGSVVGEFQAGESRIEKELPAKPLRKESQIPIIPIQVPIHHSTTQFLYPEPTAVAVEVVPAPTENTQSPQVTSSNPSSLGTRLQNTAGIPDDDEVLPVKEFSVRPVPLGEHGEGNASTEPKERKLQKNRSFLRSLILSESPSSSPAQGTSPDSVNKAESSRQPSSSRKLERHATRSANLLVHHSSKQPTSTTDRQEPQLPTTSPQTSTAISLHRPVLSRPRPPKPEGHSNWPFHRPSNAVGRSHKTANSNVAVSALPPVLPPIQIHTPLDDKPLPFAPVTSAPVIPQIPLPQPLKGILKPSTNLPPPSGLVAAARATPPTPTRRVICKICGDLKKTTDMLRIRTCAHSMCRGCLKTDMEIKLADNRIPSTCPFCVVDSDDADSELDTTIDLPKLIT